MALQVDPRRQVLQQIARHMQQDLVGSSQDTKNLLGRNFGASGFNCISSVASIALFVIACLAAAGSVSATTLGGCALGLGGGAFLLQLGGRFGAQGLREGTNPLTQMISKVANIGFDWRILAIQGLVATTIVTMGALALAGVIPGSTAGYVIFGSQLGSVVLTSSATSSLMTVVGAEGASKLSEATPFELMRMLGLNAADLRQLA